jgi:hypothetical protein
MCTPLSPSDHDALALFRAGMPSGHVPPERLALAEAIASGSPFLRQLMLRDPVFAGRVFREDPDLLLGLQLEELRSIPPDLSQAEVMAKPRQLRKRGALTASLSPMASVTGLSASRVLVRPTKHQPTSTTR